MAIISYGPLFLHQQTGGITYLTAYRLVGSQEWPREGLPTTLCKEDHMSVVISISIPCLLSHIHTDWGGRGEGGREKGDNSIDNSFRSVKKHRREDQWASKTLPRIAACRPCALRMQPGVSTPSLKSHWIVICTNELPDLLPTISLYITYRFYCTDVVLMCYRPYSTMNSS